MQFWTVLDQIFEVEFNIVSYGFSHPKHENYIHLDPWPIFNAILGSFGPKFRSKVWHSFLYSFCHPVHENDIHFPDQYVMQFRTVLDQNFEVEFYLVSYIFCLPDKESYIQFYRWPVLNIILVSLTL